MRSTILLVILVFTVISVAGPVSAGEPVGAEATPDAAPTADPAKLFGDAQARFDTGDHRGALPLFRRAYDTTKSPNARIYVARCLRELGQLAEAYDEMHATVREATEQAEQDSKYVPTRDAAAAELALLEPRIGKLIIALRDQIDGTTVQLDGQPVAPARLGVPMTLAPGLQTVVVEAPGRQRARHEIDLKGGQTRSLTVAPGKSTSAPAPADGAAVLPEQDAVEPTGGAVRIMGFVVGGLGLAAMGVMIGANVAADAEFATLEEECGTERCTDPSYSDTIDKGKTLETVANVSLVAGAVLIVTGVTMIVFGGPSEPESQSEGVALRLVPGVSTEAAYFGLHGAF
jgi:hypothetical protein